MTANHADPAHIVWNRSCAASITAVAAMAATHVDPAHIVWIRLCHKSWGWMWIVVTLLVRTLREHLKHMDVIK